MKKTRNNYLLVGLMVAFIIVFILISGCTSTYHNLLFSSARLNYDTAIEHLVNAEDNLLPVDEVAFFNDGKYSAYQQILNAGFPGIKEYYLYLGFEIGEPTGPPGWYSVKLPDNWHTKYEKGDNKYRLDRVHFLSDEYTIEFSVCPSSSKSNQVTISLSDSFAFSTTVQYSQTFSFLRKEKARIISEAEIYSYLFNRHHGISSAIKSDGPTPAVIEQGIAGYSDVTEDAAIRAIVFGKLPLVTPLPPHDPTKRTMAEELLFANGSILPMKALPSYNAISGTYEEPNAGGISSSNIAKFYKEFGIELGKESAHAGWVHCVLPKGWSAEYEPIISNGLENPIVEIVRICMANKEEAFRIITSRGSSIKAARVLDQHGDVQYYNPKKLLFNNKPLLLTYDIDGQVRARFGTHPSAMSAIIEQSNGGLLFVENTRWTESRFGMDTESFYESFGIVLGAEAEEHHPMTISEKLGIKFDDEMSKNLFDGYHHPHWRWATLPEGWIITADELGYVHFFNEKDEEMFHIYTSQDGSKEADLGLPQDRCPSR
jgi:hypothetical protein